MAGYIFKFSYRKTGFRICTLVYWFYFDALKDTPLVKSDFCPAENLFHGPVNIEFYYPGWYPT